MACANPLFFAVSICGTGQDVFLKTLLSRAPAVYYTGSERTSQVKQAAEWGVTNNARVRVSLRARTTTPDPSC